MKMKNNLEKLRRAIVLNRAIYWFSRSFLTLSILLLVIFVATRILTLEFPIALFWIFTIPLVMFAIPILKGCNIDFCAVYMDRRLGLNERIATALEVPHDHPMRGVIIADAERTLSQKDISPICAILLPKEFPVSFVLTLLLFVIVSAPQQVFGFYQGQNAYMQEKKQEMSSIVKLLIQKTSKPEDKDILRDIESKLIESKQMQEFLDFINKLKDYLSSKIESNMANPAEKKLYSELLEKLEAMGAQMASRLGADGKTFFKPPKYSPHIAKEIGNSNNPSLLPTPEVTPKDRPKIDLSSDPLSPSSTSYLLTTEGMFIPMEYKVIIERYKRFLEKQEEKR